MQQDDKHIELSLLKQIAEGNETAFRELFDRYSKRFYAVALTMTRSDHTAQEIVQEVFYTIWLQRHLLVKVESPSSYIFSIVYNSIHAHFRKLAVERKMKAIMIERESEAENPVEDMLFAKENKQLLQKAIEQLPAQQMQVYKLSKEEGLSREEIAVKLNLSPNTVRNHLHEALKSIRSYIGKHGALLVSLILSQKL